MKRNRTIAGRLWILFFLILAGARGISVKAAFDEAEAVHINAAEIEDATLAIGTHLISLRSMNDPLYTVAVQSAEESGQQEIYYKSELGDSGWYKISGASSLKAVLPEGDAVETAVIEGLFFTHHTRSDGITYDLRTGQAVSPFDIISPYDVDALPELEELRSQYQALEKSGADTGLLDDFYGQEKSRGLDEDMKLCDTRLAMLTSFYQSLARAGMPQSELEPVFGTMEKIDAQRRLASYTRIKSGLEELMDKISENSELSANAALMEALGNCLDQIQGRLDELDGEGLDAGDTALSQAESELTQELLDALESTGSANAGEDAGAAVLSQMNVLYHIRDGIHADTEQEKSFLDERLLPIARDLYETTGDKLLENEWKYYEALRTQLDGEEPENEEVLQLQEEIQRLQSSKWNALDANNLTAAEELEQQLAGSVLKLRGLEQNGVYGKASMTEQIREQKESAMKLVDGTNGNLEELRTYVEGMGALCAIYPQSAYTALEEVSEEMYIRQSDMGEDATLYDDLIEQSETILEDYADAAEGNTGLEEVVDTIMQESGCVITDNSIEGTPAEQSTALCALAAYSEQSEQEEAYELLDKYISSLTEQEAGGIFPVLALWDEGDGQDSGSGEGQGSGGEDQGSDNRDGQEQYVPASQVAAWSFCRYVWSEDYRRAVIAKGSRYYLFTAFDDCVGREKGKTETMASPALFRSTVCIPESYVEQEFGCSIQRLADTGYAVLADEAVKQKALEICGRL